MERATPKQMLYWVETAKDHPDPATARLIEDLVRALFAERLALKSLRETLSTNYTQKGNT